MLILDALSSFVNSAAAVKKMRSDDELKHIPILMCISATDRNAILNIAKLGVEGCLIKPFDGKSLVRKVRQLVAKSEHSRLLNSASDGSKS